MAKIYNILSFLTIILISYSFTSAQVFDGDWSTYYVTDDDQANGTGHNTTAVAVVEENAFVALS